MIMIITFWRNFPSYVYTYTHRHVHVYWDMLISLLPSCSFTTHCRFYRKTKLSGFQDMECIPCGDPPPPYEPHCKYSHRTWFINLSVDLQGWCFHNMTHLHKLLLHCPETWTIKEYGTFCVFCSVSFILAQKSYSTKGMPKNPHFKFLNFHVYN